MHGNLGNEFVITVFDEELEHRPGFEVTGVLSTAQRRGLIDRIDVGVPEGWLRSS